MPLYEYQCPDCGTFERMQKFSDPILTACPTCEKPVEKLLSAPAIQFKGTGWYVTDYAGKGKGKGKEGEGKEGEAKEASAKEANAKGGKGDKDAGGSKSETKKKDSSSSSKADKKPSSS